jgi:hypothetical protein
MLIEAGVDVNALDRWAAIRCSWRARIQTNRCSMRCWQRAPSGATAIGGNACHAAAKNHNDAIMRRVIDHGIDVNATNQMGSTPLMLAAESGTAKVVSLLLEAGADVHATDKLVRSVLACKNKQNAGVVTALIAAGAKITGDDLRWAIVHSNVDAVRALVDAGVNVVSELERNSELMILAVQQDTWRDSRAPDSSRREFPRARCQWSLAGLLCVGRWSGGALCARRRSGRAARQGSQGVANNNVEKSHSRKLQLALTPRISQTSSSTPTTTRNDRAFLAAVDLYDPIEQSAMAEVGMGVQSNRREATRSAPIARVSSVCWSAGIEMFPATAGVSIV